MMFARRSTATLFKTVAFRRLDRLLILEVIMTTELTKTQYCMFQLICRHETGAFISTMLYMHDKGIMDLDQALQILGVGGVPPHPCVLRNDYGLFRLLTCRDYMRTNMLDITLRPSCVVRRLEKVDVRFC